MDLRDMILYFENLEITHYGLTDGTKLAIAKGGWSPSVVRMGKITEWIDLLRYTAFKFEVKQGPEAAKYSDKSGGKALVCYSVSLEGYNSIWQKQGIQFQARLFRIDSPNDTLKDIVTRGQQLDGPNNLGCRDANGYRFVDPGTYILIPQINSSKNPEYNNKPINFTVRVFTENETKLEPWTESPAYEDTRPLPPNKIYDMADQYSNSGLFGAGGNFGGGGGGGGGGGIDWNAILNQARAGGAGRSGYGQPQFQIQILRQ